MPVRSPAGLVEYRAQYRWAAIVITVFFLVLFARFFLLQIVHGDEFRKHQEDIRHRITRVEARRGRILDRNGKVLAFNVESHDLVMFPSKAKSPENASERLRQLLWLNDEDAEQLRELIMVGMEKPGRYDKVVIRKHLANEYCPFDSHKLVNLPMLEERLWCSQCGRDLESVSSNEDRCPHDHDHRLRWNEDHTGAHCRQCDREFVAASACPHDGMALQERKYILKCPECSRRYNNEKAIIEPFLYEMPGFTIETRLRRVYPYRNVVAHVTGYLGEVNKKEMERFPERYVLRDRVGRSGVERAFERELRGTWGKRYRIREPMEPGGPLVELPVPGRADEPMINGATVRLTLDMDVQESLRRAFRYQRSGAAVVMLTETGQVLGMYSTPSFDPNRWSGRLSRQAHQMIMNNPYTPMMNKAVTAYAPGSVYKIVPAVAGLHNGVIDFSTEVECMGAYVFGGRKFRCHNRIGHGPMSLVHSLSHSCDVYYYWLGEQLGMDVLHSYATEYLGFGRPSGIGIGESTGVVPNKDWHRRKERVWMPGFTLSTAVGQKDVRATPLQVTRAFAAVANGGNLVQARIVKQFEDLHGNVIRVPQSVVDTKLPINDDELAQIREGLWRVVNDERGTAFNARVDGIEIAGKTGTAEAAEHKAGVSEELARWLKDDHAWFVGYAPARKPEVVVTVFLEHGHSGSKDAAPVAVRILKEYFARRAQDAGVDPLPNPITNTPQDSVGTENPEPPINRTPIDIE
jgi:penicillin-binding protein 2